MNSKTTSQDKTRHVNNVYAIRWNVTIVTKIWSLSNFRCKNNKHKKYKQYILLYKYEQN